MSAPSQTKTGSWFAGSSTNSKQTPSKPLYTKTGRTHPKIITLGGDHTLVLPVLRALNGVYGPVSVIHFDSHLDSWDPGFYGGDAASKASTINHGTCRLREVQWVFPINGNTDLEMLML